MNKGLNPIEKLFHESGSAAAFSARYLEHLAELQQRLDTNVIGRLVEVLLNARANGQQIFLFGNGGSAATASHFANDLAIAASNSTAPFKTLCLNDNIAALTSIANDHGYNYVFSHQLARHAAHGDVVIGISASGNSENVLTAMTKARETGCITVGLTGFSGGALKSLVDVHLHVPSEDGEYGPVEAIHLVIHHIVANYIMMHCRFER